MKRDNDNANKIISPVSLSFFGAGAPVGNNPSWLAQRSLSQTLVYLCGKKEKTVAELAERTGVPAPYVEEELKWLCQEGNGQYGLLRNSGEGKYIAGIIVAHRDEYMAVNGLYRKYASAFYDLLADAAAAGQEELRSFARRHLHKDTDMGLLLWAMIPDIIGGFVGQVRSELAEAFSDVQPSGRPFTAAAVADMPDRHCFYDCDSIIAHNVCGYSNILARNLYGSRLQAHFRCGHNIAADPLLLMTVRCAEGYPLSNMSRGEREIADRAVQQGYLRERDGILEPAILVLTDGISVYIEFQSLLDTLEENTRQLASELAGNLAGFMREHIPSHLLGDYPCYSSSIATHCFFHDVVEACIRGGILNAPASPLGPEGVLLVLCV